MDYTSALGNFGFKYVLHWRGRDLLFSFMSDKQRGWYEIWMKQNAAEAINSSDIYTEAQRTKARDALVMAVHAGEYKFGGEIFQRITQTEAGRTAFILMMLIEHQPEFTTADVIALRREKETELATILALVFAESAAVVSNATPQRRETLLQEIYAKLILPVDAGGLGISMETIAALTDRQKIEMLGKAPEPAVTVAPDELAKIDAMLRAHGALSS